MKKLFSIALIFALSMYYIFAHAQTNGINISGKVSSFEESFGLEAVSIYVKGTSRFSGTQPDGTFTITIYPEDKILIFKLEGYQTEEIILSSSRVYDVILKRKVSGYAQVIKKK
jgi:CarboxypepD_reg-like domain